MHPELSPLAAQIRFDQLAGLRHRPRTQVRDQRAMRRWRRKPRPPGVVVAPVVHLPPKIGERNPVDRDRRVA